MVNALKDLDGAIKYICDGEHEHPNRIDVCEARGQVSTQSQPETSKLLQPTFGRPSNTSAFGQSGPRVTLGQTSSTPAFGQSAGPSTFGQPSSSPFGQPSGPSTFGKPSGPISGFNQATRPATDRFSNLTFGQPSAPAPAFGQTSTPAFGQPATFGRPSTSFGQTSSTFGQPSTQASAFGQPSSQSKGFANQSSGISTFGQPSTQTPAFGQPSAPSSFAGAQQPRVYGTPNPGPFGQNVDQPKSGLFQTPPVSSFGQSTTIIIEANPIQTSAAPSNLFGAPAPVSSGGLFGAAAPVSSGGMFGQPSTTSQTLFGQSRVQTLDDSEGSVPPASDGPSSAIASKVRRSSINLPANNTATRDARGNLMTWKSKEVRQVDNNWFYRETKDSDWQRIWFPNGPPAFAKTEELPESAYDTATKEKYLFAMENGKFGDGGIPLIPPRKEWCNWNI